MRVLLIFIALLIGMTSCHTKYSGTKISDPITHSAKSISPFSVVDTLYKYANDSGLHIINESNQGSGPDIGKITDRNYGIWFLSDSILLFYQLINDRWIATDTVEHTWPFSFITQVDMNGDGYKDIKVSSIFDYAANTMNVVFLFDPKTKLYKHNGYDDLMNVTYDMKNRFIRSSYQAGMVHPQDKMKYKITADSLVFDEGITITPDEETIYETGTIEFYRMQGDSRIITRRIAGKREKIWAIFEKSFWDSSEDI